MYNKLFTKILDSSIWLESCPTRVVWVTFLAAMDEMGVTKFASVRNVARRANVSVREAREAIACLEAPDEDSGDDDHEGRRLERIQGGWLVLNAEKYRKLVTKAVEQEQTRERVRRFRERRRNGDALPSVTTVTEAFRNASVTPSEAEAGSEARSDQKQKKDAPSSRSKRPIFTGQRFVVFEWQLDDLMRLLGVETDAFDLHAWFMALDAEMLKSGEIIPQRDGGRWLQEQTLAEAARRGLQIANATPPTARELSEARAHLHRIGQCPHDPPCARAQACVVRLAQTFRQKALGA